MAATVAAPAVEVEVATRSPSDDKVLTTADTIVLADVSTALPRVAIPSPNVDGPK